MGSGRCTGLRRGQEDPRRWGNQGRTTGGAEWAGGVVGEVAGRVFKEGVGQARAGPERAQRPPAQDGRWERVPTVLRRRAAPRTGMRAFGVGRWGSSMGQYRRGKGWLQGQWSAGQGAWFSICHRVGGRHGFGPLFSQPPRTCHSPSRNRRSWRRSRASANGVVLFFSRLRFTEGLRGSGITARWERS